LGVLLALDDFGTGYSSLSHLSSLPFDKIKIDQSFIRDITSNPVNAAIVNATIAMGRSLNMTVLAEGVENDAQLEFLRNRQCEAMQGWLFSKALPSDQLDALIKSGDMLKIGAGKTAPETLLIVDDEQNILNSLRRLLRRESYEILTANSPAAGFELLAKNRVQVVISDQRMPDMSGTEFLARVKQLYPETVRIILSGYTDLESLTEAINRGSIYRFLVKPWNDEDLRTQIREAFRFAHGLAQP
jgi:CheY-like chemotaxis protein